jgi:hypothetical protein
VGDLRPGEPHEKGERRVDREPDDYGELPARGHDVVLRRPRPGDKCLAGRFQPSPAEEFRQGEAAPLCDLGGERSETVISSKLDYTIGRARSKGHRGGLL